MTSTPISKRQTMRYLKLVVKFLIPFLMIFGFPMLGTIYGFTFYCAYSTVNLLAVLPALTFTECALLILPFAAARQIYVVIKITGLQSFAGKRKLLRNTLHQFEYDCD